MGVSGHPYKLKGQRPKPHLGGSGGMPPGKFLNMHFPAF